MISPRPLVVWFSSSSNNNNKGHCSNRQVSGPNISIGPKFSRNMHDKIIKLVIPPPPRVIIIAGQMIHPNQALILIGEILIIRPIKMVIFLVAIVDLISNRVYIGVNRGRLPSGTDHSAPAPHRDQSIRNNFANIMMQNQQRQVVDDLPGT